MKNKLKRTIMEKTNWIEKIKEAVHVAMNKGLIISEYKDDDAFRFFIGEKTDIVITCFKNIILVSTNRGYTSIEYTLTDRDKLELQTLILSIKEYREAMAISELDEFISSDKQRNLMDIDELDNEDE